MTFPSDIKNAMRDCIMKLLWPKKDIVQFFDDNGCTSSDLKVLGDHSTKKRHELIDGMFNHLTGKADGGLGPFRAMLQSLTSWTHFDPYYFDKLGKLNKKEAQSAIDHLKQVQELRDNKIQIDRKKRESAESKARAPKFNILELKKQFIDLMQGAVKPQQRGYELEKILLELARHSGLTVTEPFRVVGEQIDGSVKFEGENYIIEAKWQDKASANESVYHFAQKVEGKMYGRGVFFSVNGYSSDTVKALVTGKAIRTIFVDGEDLIMVLEEMQTFSDMLDKKVAAAQNKGQIYINAITGKSKIS